VVGCGAHSLTSLQPCIPLIPEFDYVAACDLDASRAMLGLRFGARRWYQDFRRMLNAEDLQAVIVVGPATMHCEVGLACAQAGLHVFIEKPVAPSVDGARQVADAVRARGTVGMTGTMWRHAPAVRVQKRLIDHPSFGRAAVFQGMHIAPAVHAEGPGGTSTAWRYMLDQGCHMADCARFLMGPVRSVSAAVPAMIDDGHRVFISTLLRFATGATGAITYASHAAVMSPTLTVVGEAGRAVAVSNLTSLRAYPVPDELGEPHSRAQVAEVWEHGANYRGINRPGYLEELEHFARAIVGGLPADPSLDDAWRALEMCQAVLDSARSGQTVHLDQMS